MRGANGYVCGYDDGYECDDDDDDVMMMMVIDVVCEERDKGRR